MSTVHILGDTAYLEHSSAAVMTISDNMAITNEHNRSIDITPKGAKDTIKFVTWGELNDLPNQILEKAYKNTTVTTGIGFNAQMCYGDTLMVCKKIRKPDGKVEFQEILPEDDTKYQEIFDFLDDNNVNRMIQELANDMSFFYDGFVEFTLNNEKTSKIVRIRQKEALFSRLSEQDEDSKAIEYHGYSAKWHEGKAAEDLVVTPFLSRQVPKYHLKQLLGLEYYETGKKKISKHRRFIMSIALPTPGRYYYSKPYWWSIFESGWYDFACAIPTFKTALIKNKMKIIYHIYVHKDFWESLYKTEKATTDEKKIEAKKTWLQKLDKYLAGEDNPGKSFVSDFEYDVQKGIEKKQIIIEKIKSDIEGGEYIQDSEEVTNIIFSALNVHPSIVGAAPGKNKSINGTEARELFIIKQALQKPIRDMLLAPLYIVKAINNWDKDIHFVIPNITLTTLDKNTGAEKQIGMPATT